MDLDETWKVGLRPEKTKPSTFPAKSHWVLERARKMGRRGVVFFCVTWTTHHFCHFPWIDFRQTSHVCAQVVACDTWFYIPKKFPLRDRICRRTLFLGCPICGQPTGHGKRSATPTLFPSPSGHPTDLSFLGDFCWGMFSGYPPPKVSLSAMGIPRWGHSRATWREAGHYSIGL